MIGNLLLLGIATGVSAYAILQLGRMQDVTHQIARVDNALVALDKEMINSLLAGIRYERKYVLLQESALYEGFQISRSNFEKALDKALELAPEDSALKRVQVLTRYYYELFDKEVACLKTQDCRPKIPFAQEEERITNAVLEELTRLNTETQERIIFRVRQLDEAGKDTRILAIAITAAALLCGITLSIAITQSITRPLARMARKTTEIAEGKFESDLVLSSPPEIKALDEAFNIMSRKLRDVDELKANFYTMMSHELRTPLTSIREGSTMLLQGLGGEVTEKQQELLSIISEESDRLIEMVNPLLELSKLESGTLPFNFSPTDISLLIPKLVREMTPLAEAKAILLEYVVKPLPEIPIDRERMMRAIRNLIGNALKFTPAGGKVQVTADLSGKGIQVSVVDTGPGIPKEDLGIIFEKFHQGSLASSGKFHGTGLGLAVVRYIVEKHGGKIWVESKEGCGSSFIFALPS